MMLNFVAFDDKRMPPPHWFPDYLKVGPMEYLKVRRTTIWLSRPWT